MQRRASPLLIAFAMLLASPLLHAQQLAYGVFFASLTTPPIPTGSTVLYDQTDSPAAFGVPAQNLLSGATTFDNYAADDFVVPSGQTWNVRQFAFAIFNSKHTNPPVDTATVVVVRDRGGLPDDTRVVCRIDAAVPTFNAAQDAMSVTLVNACVLEAGTYWLEMQGAINFATGGQFVWAERNIQSNNAAVWKNPGNGYNSGCTNWDRLARCGVGANVGNLSFPDLIFQVIGSPNGVIAPGAVPLPVMDRLGVFLLAGLLLIFARRRLSAR